MEIYSKLQEKLAQAASACEELTKDQNSKKYKFDLQKAISTPINAISGQSGEHLMDKIRRLSSVLSGRRVRVTGREVSACDHPQGRAYCFNLLARKIVVCVCAYIVYVYTMVSVCVVMLLFVVCCPATR